MKCTIAVAALLWIPTVAYAQSAQEMIEQALAAVPGRASEGAGVIKWKADYSYETLKEGSNRLVCYHRSDERGRRPFAVQCTSVDNLDRVAQNRKFRAETADADGERAMVAAAVTNGTRVQGEYGSIWYRMEGDDFASARLHTTIMVPGATTASTGLPENREQGGAWIMGAGTDGAHIMVPGR